MLRDGLLYALAAVHEARRRGSGVDRRGMAHAAEAPLRRRDYPGLERRRWRRWRHEREARDRRVLRRVPPGRTRHGERSQSSADVVKLTAQFTHAFDYTQPRTTQTK